MPVYVVGIGNTSVRIDAPTASVAKLRAQQYFPGLYAANPTRVGSSISLADDDDGGIQFVSPNNVDEFRTRIVGASGLSVRDGGGSQANQQDSASTTIIEEDDRGISGGADLEGVPLSEANRFASFLRNLGQRGYQQGTLGRTIQERRYDPAQAAFFGEEALAGLQTPGRTPGTFESFLTGAAPGLTGLGGRARSAFGSLADLTSRAHQFFPQREGRIYDTETGFETDPQGRLGTISAFTNPDFANSNLGEQLANLALQSARSSFAPIIANELYRSDRFRPGNLQAQFQAAQGTGGMGANIAGGTTDQAQGNFVDFLRSRFGL